MLGSGPMSYIKDNIANILTISRILLLPVLIGLFFLQGALGAVAIWSCFIIYVIASATDFFDGYFARKYNQITPFGTFLDPISDKIAVSTVLLLLIAFGQISGFGVVLVILIFSREFMVSGLREYLGPKDIKMPVSNLAKWKTTVQMISSGLLILSGELAYANEVGMALLLIATILTLITGASYLSIGYKNMKN